MAGHKMPREPESQKVHNNADAALCAVFFGRAAKERCLQRSQLGHDFGGVECFVNQSLQFSGIERTSLRMKTRLPLCVLID